MICAAQHRRRHHINSRLSAARRARNAALLDLLAICDLEIGADTIVVSLAAEVVPPADPRVLQLLGAAGQPELAALYARTRTPAAPLPDHRRASRQQPDCHTSSGDTGLDGDVEVGVDGRTIADHVSAPPIRGRRPGPRHEHAGVDCVREASETLGG